MSQGKLAQADVLFSCDNTVSSSSLVLLLLLQALSASRFRACVSGLVLRPYKH